MHSIFRGLAVASVASVVALSMPAAARTSTFKVPAQNVTSAVRLLARQARIQIVVTGRVAEGRRTRAVSGTMPVEQALKEMLTGSGLVARATGEGTYVLVAEQVSVADTPAAPASDTSTILVTTQKIAQRAVDVPMTLSVNSGARMRMLGIADMGELSAYVPGLNVQIQSANNPGFVIRGITSSSGSAQEGPRVTLYYNGVDISRSRGAYQGLYDMDHVEVVKGPQATLFGTASTIGAISLLSARPQPGYSAELTTGYGNYDASKVQGHVNAGNDVIAARVAGQWIRRDGYVANLAPGQDDLYGQNQLGLRGSLRYTPSSDLTADFVLTYDRQRNTGTAFLSKSLGSSSVDGIYGAAYVGGSPYSAEDLGLDKLGLHRHVWDANFSLNWDLGSDWNFTTVNGYRHFNALEVLDADGSAAWYLEFAEHAKGFEASHEGRFSYKGRDLRASFGWNYFIDQGREKALFSTEEGAFYACSVRGASACVATDNKPLASSYTAALTRGAYSELRYPGFYETKGRNQSFSIFGDATWSAAPKLELTAGLRVLHEKRRSGYLADIPNSMLYYLLYKTAKPLIPGYYDTDGETYQAQRAYWAALPRLNALYHLNENVNLYATVSVGRRSPVVALAAGTNGMSTVPDLSIVNAEKVWNYEVGIKGRAGVLSGSLGVYYDDYSNFQVNVFDPESGVSRTHSAGSARNLGVEGELEAQVTSWLKAFGNFGFISGGIDDKADNGVFAGNRFRLQPKWQSAVGLLIDAPLSREVRLFVTPTLTYRSKVYFNLPNSEALSQSPVTLANLRGGLRLAGGRFELAGWAKNLTDRRYVLDAGNIGSSFGYPTYVPAEPRTYGLEITARY
jgi:outer membrane receptor protein involved in Fe transport